MKRVVVWVIQVCVVAGVLLAVASCTRSLVQDATAASPSRNQAVTSQQLAAATSGAVTSSSTASAAQAGYWLVNAGSSGAGIVVAAAGSTPPDAQRAVLLAAVGPNAVREIVRGWPGTAGSQRWARLVRQVGLVDTNLLEVNVRKLAEHAVASGQAWISRHDLTTPTSEATWDPTFTIVATTVVGGVAAPIVSGAGLVAVPVGAAVGAGAGLVGSGVVQLPSCAADLVACMVRGAQAMDGVVGDAASATTSVDLSAPWARSMYTGLVMQIGGLLALLMTFIGIAGALARRSPSDLGETLFGAARAAVGTGIALGVTVIALAAAHEVSHAVQTQMPANFFQTLSRAWDSAGAAGFATALIALAEMLVDVVLWLEFKMAGAAVVLAVMLLPLALGASVKPSLESWQRRCVLMLAMCIMLPPVAMIGLWIGVGVLAGALSLTGGLVASLSALLSGLLIVVLAAASPWVLLFLVGASTGHVASMGGGGGTGPRGGPSAMGGGLEVAESLALAGMNGSGGDAGGRAAGQLGGASGGMGASSGRRSGGGRLGGIAGGVMAGMSAGQMAAQHMGARIHAAGGHTGFRPSMGAAAQLAGSMRRPSGPASASPSASSPPPADGGGGGASGPRLPPPSSTAPPRPQAQPAPTRDQRGARNG